LRCRPGQPSPTRKGHPGGAPLSAITLQSSSNRMPYTASSRPSSSSSSDDCRSFRAA
jgi:hypothetical protein